MRKYFGKISYHSLGKTYDKREIWCLRLGRANAPKKLVIDAAIHAREWLNTQVLMRHTEEMLRNYSKYHEHSRKVCIYIIPMNNPDGVSISQYGYQAIRNEKLQKKVKKSGISADGKTMPEGLISITIFLRFRKSKKAKKETGSFIQAKRRPAKKRQRL